MGPVSIRWEPPRFMMQIASLSISRQLLLVAEGFRRGTQCGFDFAVSAGTSGGSVGSDDAFPLPHGVYPGPSSCSLQHRVEFVMEDYRDDRALMPAPRSGARPEGVLYFSLGTNGAVRSWSRALSELVGMTAEEARVRGWLVMAHPEDVAGLRDAWGCSVEEKWDFRRCFRVVRADGSVVEVKCESEAAAEPSAERIVVLSPVAAVRGPECGRSEEGAELEHYLALAARGAGYGVWVHDLKSQQLEWDARMCAIHGCEAGVVVGSGDAWRRLVHPGDLGLIDSRIAELLSGREIESFEFRIIRADDGATRRVEATGYLQRDDRGAPQRLVGLARDVTEQREAASRLAQLEACVERITDIVMITEAEPLQDPGPRILYVNEAFERITGYKRKEVIGKTPRMLQGARTSRAELDRIREALRRWEPVHAELINYTKSGEEFWLELEISPVPDSTGWYTHWVAVERDVTERKRAEESLRRATQMLDATQRLGRIGGWEVELEQGTLYWTDETYVIHDVRPESFAPTLESAMGFLTEESRARLRGAYDRAVQTGEPYDLELELVTALGRKVWVQTACSVTMEDGRATKIGGSIQDITERRRAECALRESKDRLEALFNNALNGILLAGDDGRYVEANPAVCRMVGYTREELLGMSVGDLTAEGAEEGSTRERFSDFISSGKMRGMVRLRRKDGRVITAEYSAVANVQPGVHLSILSDVTEWLEAQEALRKNEVRYSLAISAVNDGIWDWNVQEDRAYFSKQYYTMLGYDEADFPASYESWRGLIHPDDVVAAERRVRRAIERVTGFDLDLRMRAKGGAWRWIKSRGRVVERDEMGRTVRMVGTHTDISVAKNLSEKLRESYSLFAALAEQVPGVLYQYRQHPDGRTCMPFASRGLWEIFELTPEQVREDATPALNRIHLEDIEGLMASVEQSAQTLEPWRHEFRVVLPDQGTKWRRGEARPARLEDGSILWHGFITDITGQRNAEHLRESLRAELLQSQKMESVGLLAGGVAHDFNNMLTVILAHAEIAMSQVEQDSVVGADLRAIRDSAQRSAELTRQLLAYARKQKTRPEVVDINATVSRMISMLRRLIGENIELKWKPARSLWPVMLDPTHLDQILTNLVVNARDAIEGSGSIVIETRRSSLEETICARIPGAVPGDYVRISVTDTGKGMDKGTLARVFEPFFTTKDIGHGSGLGLSTVYGTVKQNAGFIEVFSAPRSGATFDVYLPRHTGEEVASARDEAPPAVLPGGTETILVVEDEPRLLELTVKVLRSDGYTVLGAPGPQEALNLAAGLAGEIHLLVTDVVMPVMSGPQLRDQLVSSRSSLRTIFMSGYAADKIAPQETEKAGFLFLQKPFTVDELRALVRSVLELAR